MNIRIFVLCFDDHSQEQATVHFGNYDWATILRIPTTMYMENWMFSTWFPQNVHEWHNCDYVGTLSWKAFQKIKPPNMLLLKNRLFIQDPDVFAFMPNLNRVYPTLLSQADSHHPLFSKLWIEWLQQLGFDEVSASDPTVRAFYCNYWIAKPSWLRKYCEFCVKAQTVLETYQPMQENLWSDTTYEKSISDERCIEIYKRPYYPYHCFLLERLPSFYFNKAGAKIMF